MEAFAVSVDCKREEIAKVNAKRKGRVNPNNLKERAGNGRPNKRVNLDGLDDRAGNRRPKTRSTKVLIKSGLGFSVETVNEDASIGDDFSLASGDKARTTSLMTRQRERPSGHAQLEQRLGEEDCAGVVCWQKPPGCTGICRRCCWFFTGWCNKCRQLSVGQEADGWVAAPPSLNGLVGRIVQRRVQQV